ncbi:MAG: glycosyltransferase family 61 protein [Desulfovibrio sp.]|jgi:hypothetical protein|nr:glycosyltransferase family 61 protein [Desulfovibrio sp.]
MHFSFDPQKAILASAGDYLDHFQRRGRAVHLEHLGIICYGVTDCLYLGEKSQVLLPLEGTALPLIFTESCHYPAGDCRLTSLAQVVLSATTDFLEVDEAAPFYAPGSDNLWHWTAENLPKLLALESIGYSGKYIVPLESKVARESLVLFHIPPERLLPAKAAYRVKRLLLPQRLSGFDLPYYLPLVEFTRNKLLEAVGTLPGGKRCYIRRTGRRKPVNEENVLDLLRGFDFETMLPEDLSLAEQWRYMTNVDCSVMAHGANSTLTLLQKPRSAFVELFGNRYVSYNNLHAARLLRLKYHALVQDLDVSSAPLDMSLADFLWGGLTADMVVDITHLRILLETLLE